MGPDLPESIEWWRVLYQSVLLVRGREIMARKILTGLGTLTASPETWPGYHDFPYHVTQATWSSPLSNRILLEAGWGTYQSRYRNPGPRIDGSHNDRMIRLTEQGGEIPNLVSRMPAGVGGGFNHHLIGTLANNMAAISYCH